MARTRRTFATLLGAGLLATSLAACGGGDDSDDDTQAPPSQSEDTDDSGDRSGETGSEGTDSDDAQGGTETDSDDAGTDTDDSASDDAGTGSDDSGAEGQDDAGAAGGELSEEEACGEYQEIIMEFGSASGDPSDLAGMTEGLEEYTSSLSDLSERSPENLATLFQAEADYIDGLASGSLDPAQIEENATNSTEIAEICSGV